MRNSKLLPLLFILLAGVAHALEHTPATRERAQVRDYVMGLFLQQEWKNLDELAARFRKPDERMITGDSRLPTFYRGAVLGFARLEKERPGAGDEALRQWLAARPESMSARLLAISSVIDKAWKIRGSGTIETVSDEALEKFHAELRQAWGLLLMAEQLPDRDPFLYELAIRVGTGLGLDPDKMEQVLAKAISVAPDYQPVYDAMAVYLLPRWMGEEGDVRTFAEYVADKVTSSGGDIRYALIAYKVLNWEGVDTFEKHKFSIEKIRNGLLAREANFPDPSFTYNVLGRFYLTLEDQKAASQIFAKLPGKYDAEAANVWGSSHRFVEFLDWAAGKTNLAQESEMQEIIFSGDIDKIKAYIDKLPDVNARDPNDMTPLQYALTARTPEIVHALIARGADLTASTPFGAPIHESVRAGMPDIVQLALSKGANPREPATRLQWLPIHYATATTSTEALALLLKAAPDTVNARTAAQETPLVLAAGFNNANAVRMLLQANADPNLKDKMDFTPLHKAAYYGYNEPIQVLIEHKADLNIPTKNGKTPLQLARIRQRQSTVELLEQHGAK